MKQLILFPIEPEPLVLPELENTTYVHFESVDPEQNRYRFYTITWQKTLWDEWTIRTTWGRIGGDGRSQVTYFESEQALRVALPSIVGHRLERGYVVRGVGHSTVRQSSLSDGSSVYQLSNAAPRVDTEMCTAFVDGAARAQPSSGSRLNECA